MISAFRSVRRMIMVFFVMVIIAGCTIHPPVAGPVSPPAISDTVRANKIVVAKVNNANITMDALVKMMNRFPGKSDALQETLETRRKKALDALVLLELAYQRASALGLSIDPNKIDIALGNFKDNAGGEKEYREYLSGQNITESDLRSEMERSFAIELIYNKEVVDSVSIPEEELRKEYEKQKQRLIRPEAVSIIDVYLLKDEGKASKKKAGELLSRIKADAGRDPWNLVLDGTFVVRKLVARRDRDKELYDAAKKLKPQGLSDAINTPTGIHIIKLESYSPERPFTFDEAKPEIEASLKSAAVEKKTQAWELQLKKNAKIELAGPEVSGRK